MKKFFLSFSVLAVVLLCGWLVFQRGLEPSATPVPESKAFNDLCLQHFNTFKQQTLQDSTVSDSSLLAALPLFSSTLSEELGALPEVEKSKLRFRAYYDLGMGRYYFMENGSSRVVQKHELEEDVQNSFNKVQACVIRTEVKHGTAILIRDRLYLSMHEML